MVPAKTREYGIIIKVSGGANQALRKVAKSLSGVGREARKIGGKAAGAAGAGGAAGIFGALTLGAAKVFKKLVFTIGKILWKLVGVAAKIVGSIIKVFGKLVKSLAGIFGSVVRMAGRTLGRIPKLLLLVGGAAAGASIAFSAFVNAVAKGGDELSKLSTRTGLSVKFLSEMQHVLQLADADVSDFEKAIKALGGAVEGATRGATEYQEVFDRLGVSIYQSNGKIKDSETLFMQLSDALRRVKSDVLRVGLAQRLFGRAAQQMLPMIMSTTQSIREGREEARRLGITWSVEASQAAVKFRDNLTRVKNALRGLRKAFFEPFLEGFSERLERLSDRLSSHREQVRRWGERAAEIYERWSERATNALAQVWNYLTSRDWGGALRGLPQNLGAIFKDIGGLFARKTEKGWEMGGLTNLILAGFKRLAAEIREVFYRLWEDVLADFRKKIGKALLRMAVKFRGPVLGPTIGRGLGELSRIGLTKNAAERERDLAKIRERQAELDRELAEVTKALTEQRRAIARSTAGLLPGKPPEEVERERAERAREGAERRIRGTEEYKAAEARIGKRKAIGALLGEHKFPEKAKAAKEEAELMEKALRSYLQTASDLLQRHDATLQEIRAELLHHSRLLNKLGRSRAR